MRNFINFIILFFLAFTLTSEAAKISDNILSIGNKLVPADILINSPDGGFLKKTNGGEWLFSNDGVLEKAIGSGGGGGAGGVNLVLNQAFEDGHDKEWLFTGGATGVTVTTGVDLGFGEKSAKITYSSAGTYCTALNTKPNALGFGCVASIYYKDAGTNHKMKVYDGSANVLVDLDLLASTSWVKTPDQTFECKDQMKLCLEGDSGSIVLDDTYLGNNKNFVSVTPNAKVIASVKLEGSDGRTITADTESIPFDGVSSFWTSGADGSTATSGNYYTVQRSDTTLSIDLNLYGSLVSVANLAIMKNGVYYKGVSTYTDSGRGKKGSYLSKVGEFSAGDKIAFITSGDQIGTLDTTPSIHYLNINETYYPDASQAAWYPEAQNFRYEGYVSGANVSINSATRTQQPFSSSELTLNNVKGYGLIPCAGVEESSGSTCTGNENIGVALVLPVVGYYKVCMNTVGIAYNMNTQAELWVSKTENAAETNLEISKERAFVFNNEVGSNAANNVRICSIHNIESIGKKTFRLIATNNTAGTATINANYNITVELISQGVNKPYVINQVDTTAKGGTTIRTCYIQNNGTASYDTSDPACAFIDSVSRTAAGTVNVNTVLNADFVEKCVVNGKNISEAYILFGTWTNGDFTVNTSSSTGAGIDRPFTIICTPNR